MKSKPRKERKRNREKTSQDKGFMKKKNRGKLEFQVGSQQSQSVGFTSEKTSS